MTLRVGQGFDVHPFSTDPARRLVLGGVRLDGPGLSGHSDADVVCHAITDALLGASGSGDIGSRFPDTDQRWEGADSLNMLAVVAQELAAQWAPVNVDVTVLAERPHLARHRVDMQSRLALAVGAPVNVKAKRGEGLGAIGRAEGIACLAIALLQAK